MSSNRYLLIGHGRLARHLAYYLTNLGISHRVWQRSNSISDLRIWTKDAERVLLLISDVHLQDFFDLHLADLANATSSGSTTKFLHCSGATQVIGCTPVHPLMAFGKELYDQEFYPTIPFVTTNDVKDREQLLPGLPNPVLAIPEKLRQRYHALCVLGANFSSLLALEMQKGLVELGLPAHAGDSLVEKSISMALKNQDRTGPLVRRDWQTLDADFSSLEGHPLQKVFAEFMEAYR